MNRSQSDNSAPAPPRESLGLGEIFRILVRQKLIIISLILLCIGAAAIYTWRQPNQYEAICRIDIDLTTPKSGIDLASAAQASSTTDQKMATQLGILSSQAIAWDVITKLQLYNQAEFMGPGVPKLSTDPNSFSDVLRYALIRLFQGGLTVQYERGTEIAQIRYKSRSPELAAKIANAIARSYIDRNFETKFNITRDTSTWITNQLQSLRKQVADDEEAFASFQKKSGLLQTDDTHNSILDRVTQLNNALSVAQTQRIQKEIAFRESESSDPDQVLPAASLPTLQALRNQKSNLDSQYASLTTKYGDAYPRVAQLKSQIEQVQAAINKQIQIGRDQLQLEYRAALENETKLKGAVEAQKQEVFSLNEDALRYSLLQRQVVSSRGLYEDLTRKLQEAQITSGLSSDAISIIDPALAPNIPSEPRKTLNMEVGLLLGLILGVALAFIIESANATVRTVEDINLYSGLPLLGLVPHFEAKRQEGASTLLAGATGPYILNLPESHYAEAFRSLRSTLLLSSAGAPPQLIAICSAWPQEGKSTAAINLATVLAQTGQRVLLVDADLKRPTLHFKLGFPPATLGLSGLLTQAEHPEIRSYVHSGVGVPSLDFLPSGRVPPSSAELLMSTKMSQLIDDWRSEYSFIVIDTAPILSVSDASAIAAGADTTVLVVRSGVTRRQALRSLRDAIDGVSGKVAGVLLNDVEATSEAYYSYYGQKSANSPYGDSPYSEGR